MNSSLEKPGEYHSPAVGDCQHLIYDNVEKREHLEPSMWKNIISTEPFLKREKSMMHDAESALYETQIMPVERYRSRWTWLSKDIKYQNPSKKGQELWGHNSAGGEKRKRYYDRFKLRVIFVYNLRTGSTVFQDDTVPMPTEALKKHMVQLDQNFWELHELKKIPSPDNEWKGFIAENRRWILQFLKFWKRPVLLSVYFRERGSNWEDIF